MLLKLKLLSLGLGLIFCVSNCKSLDIKDLAPYKIVFFLNSEGKICTFKKITDKEPWCITPIELYSTYPEWRDNTLIIHNKNLQEKFIDMLNNLKSETLK